MGYQVLNPIDCVQGKPLTSCTITLTLPLGGFFWIYNIYCQDPTPFHQRKDPGQGRGFINEWEADD